MNPLADRGGSCPARLAARGFVLGHGAVSCNVEMGWVGGKGRVTLGAHVMLPDGPVTCPADVGV